MKLLELLIALALSAILYLVIDTIYSGLWRTRAMIHQAQDELHLRQLPDQLFGKLLLHAGNLGCRAVRDGIVIQAAAPLPKDFFLQQGQAVHLQQNELWVHETLAHQITWSAPIQANTRVAPAELAQLSGWLLISDCVSAEMIPYGGDVTQAYHAPSYISAVILTRWYVKNNTLYRQQVYPHHDAQPVANGVRRWEWRRSGSLLLLHWEVNPQGDEYVFELGNS